MLATGCIIGQTTNNNVKELISDSIICNIKNELSSVIKIRTTLGVISVQTNKVGEHIMKTLLLRALELKIKQCLNNRVESRRKIAIKAIRDIIKENKAKSGENNAR